MKFNLKYLVDNTIDKIYLEPTHIEEIHMKLLSLILYNEEKLIRREYSIFYDKIRHDNLIEDYEI